jgi:hypothetical protein
MLVVTFTPPEIICSISLSNVGKLRNIEPIIKSTNFTIFLKTYINWKVHKSKVAVKLIFTLLVHLMYVLKNC